MACGHRVEQPRRPGRHAGLAARRQPRRLLQRLPSGTGYAHANTGPCQLDVNVHTAGHCL